MIENGQVCYESFSIRLDTFGSKFWLTNQDSSVLFRQFSVFELLHRTRDLTLFASYWSHLKTSFLCQIQVASIIGQRHHPKNRQLLVSGRLDY